MADDKNELLDQCAIWTAQSALMNADTATGQMTDSIAILLGATLHAIHALMPEAADRQAHHNMIDKMAEEFKRMGAESITSKFRPN